MQNGYWKQFIKVDKKKKIVVFCPKGLIESDELAEIGKSCRKLAHKKGYKLFIDFSEADITAGIPSAYNWFKKYYSKEEYHLKAVPTAHISAPDHKEVFDYVDAVWPQMGINTRAFKTKKEAYKWLKDSDYDLLE